MSADFLTAGDIKLINRPKVVNMRDLPPDTRYRLRRGVIVDNTVYCGRPARWRNIFVIGTDGTREEVIDQFKAHVAGEHHRIKLELRGFNLACWCAPLPCHCDHLLEVANSW